MSKNAENHWRLVLSIDEAANACNLSRATVYRLISAGKLATVKIGSRRLVPLTALETLLEKAAAK
jgi:excisionase family DNA binding protein